MIRHLWTRLFGNTRSRSRSNHPSNMDADFSRFREAMRFNNPDIDDDPPKDTLASDPWKG